MKKKLFLICLAALLAIPAYAVYTHPPIQVYVDGNLVTFSDQEPVIVDDRTLVPMRRIFEAMGATVTWSEPLQTITSVRNQDTITMTIGDDTVYRNGTAVYTMDVPAQIMQDRTMVPVRAIAESFGASVGWDGKTYTITIATTGSTEQTAADKYQQMVYADDGTLLLTVDYSYTPLQGTQPGVAKVNTAVRNELAQKGAAITKQYTEIAQKLYASAQNDGTTFTPCYCMGTYRASGEKDDFASIVLEERSSTGSSEEVSLTTHTYFMKDGTEAYLADIIPDSQEDVKSLIVSGFSALIDAEPNGFYGNAKENISTYIAQTGFYLTQDGIVFYLNPGIIAEEFAGVVAFSVPYTR